MKPTSTPTSEDLMPPLIVEQAVSVALFLLMVILLA
jgi:hypothetical protein